MRGSYGRSRTCSGETTSLTRSELTPPSTQPLPERGYAWCMSLYAVRLRRGGPWDWSRDMREQADWGEHARFSDGLVDAGWVLLGGRLACAGEWLFMAEAESGAAIRERLAEDPWAPSGMLSPV